MIVGIDGSNVRTGGCVTHLVHLLEMAEPEAHGIRQIIVWASRELLERLPKRAWLDERHEPWLDGALPARLLWQRFRLPRLANRQCDLLFAPGGSAPHRFSPVVTMSRNMLPFEPAERRRYGLSPIGIRLMLLRLGQANAFRRADGLIFLTEYAREAVTRKVPRSRGTAVIPHGVADRFRAAPRPQRPLEDCSFDDPLLLLYVSIVDVYKHHVPVARAVARLREEGLPVVADFVGPAYPSAMRAFQSARKTLDPDGRYLRYQGAVPHAELPDRYRDADVFVFASSCENMPNILLEAMAAGLPVASSDRGPMPEVLAGSGLLFDPEDPESIATALRRLVTSAELRQRLAREAHVRAQAFSWERCARETLAFLRQTYDDRAAGNRA